MSVEIEATCKLQLSKFSQNYEIVSVEIFKYCKKLLNLEKNYQFEKIIKYGIGR